MILDDIVRDKRVELGATMAQTPLTELRARELFHLPRRDFEAALRSAPRAIIAEIKKASPSKGVIRADFDPLTIADQYSANGAAAISVLTEQRYFQGKLEYLAAIRREVPLPLLRKDFLFDPYQVYEARAYGADAVLLIVAILSDQQLVELGALARALELAVLVEVHDRDELARAQQAGARLIGINNRDLRTFHTTLRTTEELAPLVGGAALVVAESGVDAPADIARLEQVGVHCFLIGESLMRAPLPGARLAELLR